MERLVFGAVGLLAVAAVSGVFWLVVGELSPAQPVNPVSADSPSSSSEPVATVSTAPANAPSALTPDEPPDETSAGVRPDGDRPKRGGSPKRRLAGESASMRPTPESGDKGSVSGRVVDGTGTAVAGANVSLLLRRGSFLGSFDDEKALETETGPDGTFRLGPLEPGGRFIVKVRHGKFAEEQVDGIGVKAGEETVLGDVRLTLGAAISGRVADAAGVPIAGAKIIVESGNFFGIDVRKEEGNVVRSGADGAYVVRRVSTGSKNVYCWAKGFSVAVRRLESVEEQTDTVSVDFTLGPARTISGTVTDEESRPVEGADVFASPVDYKDASRGMAKTDAAGKFVLEDLSEGQFHVFASAEGYTRPEKRTVPSGSEGIDFKLLVNGGIAGRVIDLATSAPVTSFSVRYARTKDGKPMGFGKRQKFESPEGAFEIDDLDPGRYQVQVSADGYATKVSDEVDVARKDVATNVVVALDHGSILRGLVVKASDRAPIAGALVVLRSDSSRDLFGNDLSGGFGGGGFRRAPGGVRTGADGRYIIENVGPGEYALDVTHDEFAPQRVEGVVIAEGGAHEAPDTILSRGGTVSGIVRGEDGLSDPKAQVTLTGPRFDKKTRTDREGKFAFDRVPPGEYVVAVTMRGGQVDLGGLFGVDDEANTVIVRDGEAAKVDP
jgi:protocatechuate 3,4-dioxygenase beta subunit